MSNPVLFFTVINTAILVFFLLAAWSIYSRYKDLFGVLDVARKGTKRLSTVASNLARAFEDQ